MSASTYNNWHSMFLCHNKESITLEMNLRGVSNIYPFLIMNLKQKKKCLYSKSEVSFLKEMRKRAIRFYFFSTSNRDDLNWNVFYFHILGMKDVVGRRWCNCVERVISQIPPVAACNQTSLLLHTASVVRRGDQWKPLPALSGRETI